MGGDLSPSRLLLAYRSGLFPWTVKPVTWWSPDPRGVLELDGFHVSHSLAKVLRKGRFQITRDQAFEAVMAGCAAPGPGRRGTCDTPEFIAAYTELHRRGQAHSLECWLDGDLAGGVYGVAVGGLFAVNPCPSRRERLQSGPFPSGSPPARARVRSVRCSDAHPHYQPARRGDHRAGGLLAPPGDGGGDGRSMGPVSGRPETSLDPGAPGRARLCPPLATPYNFVFPSRLSPSDRLPPWPKL